MFIWPITKEEIAEREAAAAAWFDGLPSTVKEALRMAFANYDFAALTRRDYWLAGEPHGGIPGPIMEVAPRRQHAYNCALCGRFLSKIGDMWVCRRHR